MNKTCPLPGYDICNARCEWFDEIDKTCIVSRTPKGIEKLVNRIKELTSKLEVILDKKPINKEVEEVIEDSGLSAETVEFEMPVKPINKARTSKKKSK